MILCLAYGQPPWQATSQTEKPFAKLAPHLMRHSVGRDLPRPELLPGIQRHFGVVQEALGERERPGNRGAAQPRRERQRAPALELERGEGRVGGQLAAVVE